MGFILAVKYKSPCGAEGEEKARFPQGIEYALLHYFAFLEYPAGKCYAGIAENKSRWDVSNSNTKSRGRHLTTLIRTILSVAKILPPKSPAAFLPAVHTNFITPSLRACVYLRAYKAPHAGLRLEKLSKTNLYEFLRTSLSANYAKQNQTNPIL